MRQVLSEDIKKFLKAECGRASLQCFGVGDRRIRSLRSFSANWEFKINLSEQTKKEKKRKFFKTLIFS